MVELEESTDPVTITFFPSYFFALSWSSSWYIVPDDSTRTYFPSLFDLTIFPSDLLIRLRLLLRRRILLLRRLVLCEH